MWDSPKKLLAAGALVVLAGTRSPAQDPSVGGKEIPLTLPAPAFARSPSQDPRTGGQEKPLTPAASSLQIQTLAITESAPASSATAPSQDTVERLPALTNARPAVPAAACPATTRDDGVEARTHAHPPLLSYRKDYQSPPLGAMMHEAFQIQVNNGIAARMVLYEYDFICGGDKLNVRGSDHLRQIVQYWRTCGYPLIIERTPYAPGIAQARRSTVINQLAEQGIAVPQNLVVIGVPPAIPLRGFDAQVIYQNLINQTQSRGNVAGQGTGAAGGTSQQGAAGGAAGATPQP